MTIKQLNVKNRKYYLYNGLINIKKFDPSLLRLDKKESANINIYYINYIRKKPRNIKILDPIYLFIKELDGFIEENNGNKYLNIVSTDSNEDVLIMYEEIWVGIKDEIKKINNGIDGEYDKDYMKVKFDSDDDLSLNILLKFHTLTIIIRYVFEKNGKYYPQIFLYDYLYEI